MICVLCRHRPPTPARNLPTARIICCRDPASASHPVACVYIASWWPPSMQLCLPCRSPPSHLAGYFLCSNAPSAGFDHSSDYLTSSIIRLLPFYKKLQQVLMVLTTPSLLPLRAFICICLWGVLSGEVSCPSGPVPPVSHVFYPADATGSCHDCFSG